MRTISATEARAKQAAILEEAANGEPVRITRRVGGDVVMISAEEYQEFRKAGFDRAFDKAVGRFGGALKALADK